MVEVATIEGVFILMANGSFCARCVTSTGKPGLPYVAVLRRYRGSWVQPHVAVLQQQTTRVLRLLLAIFIAAFNFDHLAMELMWNGIKQPHTALKFSAPAGMILSEMPQQV